MCHCCQQRKIGINDKNRGWQQHTWLIFRYGCLFITSLIKWALVFLQIGESLQTTSELWRCLKNLPLKSDAASSVLVLWKRHASMRKLQGWTAVTTHMESRHASTENVIKCCCYCLGHSGQMLLLAQYHLSLDILCIKKFSNEPIHMCFLLLFYYCFFNIQYQDGQM